MFAIKACLYCVFTEWCNQCNCERVFLTEMSVLFLSAWVQVGTCWICFPVFLISKCKCISWFVSASVYTPFFIVLLFPGSNTNNRGSISEWDINSNLRQQFCSLRGKICSYTVRCKEPYNTQTNKKKWFPLPWNKLPMFFSASCSASWWKKIWEHCCTWRSGRC